jgi:hypothetical protein
MSIDGTEYIQESRERRQRFQTDYDPLRGIGSPLDRFPLPLGADMGTVHLPEALRDHTGIQQIWEAGSAAAFAEQSGTSLDTVLAGIRALRSKTDFEWWCAAVARIENKRGNVVPFILNRPQRRYVKHLEKQRLAGDPVRAIVLKHRQWGSTTLSYTYIAWHQIELHERRDAWFVGLDTDGARDVLARYDLIREKYGLGDLSLRPYAGMRNTRVIPERECTLSVGTVRRPNAPSGRTPQFTHLFEVGKWPSNQTESAEKVVTNMESMLVDEPGTISIIESTMQGSTGTYFKELCDRARSGESAYDFLFMSVFDDPQYWLEPGEGRPLESYAPGDVEDFVAGWDEDLRRYWKRGATLEQLNWYARQRTKPGYIVEPWRLKEEFPVEVEEAFQVGEQRVFPQAYTDAARATAREPDLRGELRGNALTGREALDGITFESDPRGRLKVWRKPGDNYSGLLDSWLEKEGRLANRYCAFSDVGPGQSADADYSVTTVLDRAPLLFGGWPEVVAEWRGHEDPDRYAWIAARLCAWYDNAYWGIEANSYEAEKEMDERAPDYGLTVVDEVKHHANLYHRRIWDKDEQEWTKKAGWYTTKETKQLLISSLTKHLRGAKRTGEDKTAETAYVERSHRACKEISNFQHIEGKMRAPSGKKDDCVITHAGVCFLNEEMGPPTVKAPRTQPTPSTSGATRI